jgi:hypothetical protein
MIKVVCMSLNVLIKFHFDMEVKSAMKIEKISILSQDNPDRLFYNSFINFL